MNTIKGKFIYYCIKNNISDLIYIYLDQIIDIPINKKQVKYTLHLINKKHNMLLSHEINSKIYNKKKNINWIIIKL